MKHISFLGVGLLAVLLVTGVGCGLPMGATGDYYEEAPVRRNVYYGDPYYRRSNTIIVERDPFTGRYYEVGPGPYGSVYGTPVYPYTNRRYYNNRNNSRNNGYYKTYPQKQPQQSPVQREKIRQEREQAKESILGKKRN